MSTYEQHKKQLRRKLSKEQQKYAVGVHANRTKLNRLSSKKYPYLHKVLNKGKGAMLNRIQFVLYLAEYTPNQQFRSERFWFFCPLSRFMREGAVYARTKDTWEHTLILSICIGLVERRIPEGGKSKRKYERKAIQTAIEQKHLHATAFYSIPPYTEDHLCYMEDQARKWIEGHGNFNDFSKATIIKIFGQDIANKIYQDERTTIRKKDRTEERMGKELTILLMLNRYTTKEILIAATVYDYPSETRYTVTKAWERASHSIVSAAGARHHRPTKAEKEKYGLIGEGWIITQGLSEDTHIDKNITISMPNCDQE